MSGVYSPLPQSQSDSDSERELRMESLCDTGHNSNGESIERKRIKPRGLHLNTTHNFPEAKVIKKRMTSVRKVSFVFSIIICFLPIVVFLWILPCDMETCPVKITNWETQQEGVEMKGMINLFFDNVKKHFNLAMLYKGEVTSEEDLKHGAISFLGNNGGVNWYFRQSVEPERLDCSMIDVDRSGVRDCLLLDEKGLKAVEVFSGQTIWHAHSHEERTLIENLQFPIMLKDLNQDGVNELVSIYQKKYLMIICGRTGKALSNLKISECNEVQDLSQVDSYLTLHCFNGSFPLHLKIKTSVLIENFSENGSLLQFEKYDYTPSDTNSFLLKGYKLDIMNQGSCPDCSSTIKLFNTKEKLVYSRSFNKSYIMKPVKFKFESSQFKMIGLKKHSQGYIVKIWDWFHRFNPKRSTDYPFNFKRDSLNNTNYGNNIVERVILITVNNTDHNIIEASAANITQLCFLSASHIPNCQPDIKNQEYSLMISDLDRDGSQELITYSSSFYFRDGFNLGLESWKLISTIKLLQLESELPKLYDSRQTFGIFSNY